MKTKILLLIILIQTACTPQPPITNGTIELHFCPQTNCTNILYNYLKTATTITCAFYDIDEEIIITTLTNKQARIIIDEEAPPITNAHKRKGKGIMHNKYCVINKTTIITGSYNPTKASRDDYNNLIIIASPALANHYLEAHKQLLTNTKKPSTHTTFIHNNHVIEAYNCPQDHCKEHIIKELSQAQHTITLALFTFTDNDIASLIKQKLRQGVKVTGIIESFQQQKTNQYYSLRQAGANITLETTPRLQHNKLFIIDHNTVITGSYNPTKAAATINDENILIIHDQAIAQTYEHMINHLTQSFK